MMAFIEQRVTEMVQFYQGQQCTGCAWRGVLRAAMAVVFLVACGLPHFVSVTRSAYEYEHGRGNK